MDEIEVAINSFTDNRKSALFDDYERLSVEIQLNQAMLRRSLSEPGTSMFRAHLGVGAPPLVRVPVEQGKRSSSGYGLHKIVKKLLRPVFWNKKWKGKEKGNKDDHHHKEQQQPSTTSDDKDFKSWKRFSKSVRYY